MNPFSGFTRLRYNYSDPLDRLRAQNLVWLALVDLVLAVLSIVLAISPSGSTTADTISALTVAALSLISGITIWYTVNRGALVWGSLAYLLLIFVRSILIGLPYNPSQLVSPNALVYMMPIIAAGVLLNLRATLVMSALCGAAITLTTVLNYLGLLLNSPTTGSGAFSIAVNVAILVVAGLLLGIYSEGQRQLLRRSLKISENAGAAIRAGQSIKDVDELDDLFRRTIAILRDQMGFYYAQIFATELQSGLVIQFTSSRAAPNDLRRTPLEASGVINAVIHDGKVRHVSQTSPLVDRSEMLLDAQAEVLIPMRSNGRILGVLDVQGALADGLIERNLEILEAIASELGAVIVALNLSGELEIVKMERQRLAEQVRAATQEIARLGREVNNQAWSRYLEGRGDRTIGFDWRQGSIVLNSAMSPSLERILDNALPEIWIDNDEKVLAVPILSRGQLLGAMEFRAPANQDWNNRSIELARLIGQRLALALDNIRLYEEAQIVANREQVANQVAARLQSKTDIDSLLVVATESFQQALGANRASIRLGDPGLNKPGNGNRS